MIRFAKLRTDARIPTKEEGSAGFDIYACFDEPYLKLPAHKTTMVPTGVSSIIPEYLYAQMFNRGSNGSKGITQSCGVVDPNYRGEWFVAYTNQNDEDWYICKKEFIEHNLILKQFINIYQYEKAICQYVLLPIMDETNQEVSPEEIEKNITNRGTGSIGSSGK